MTQVTETTIDELTPDLRNANKGTQRGRRALDNSLRQYGAGRSILVDKHGRIIAGNKTVERAADLGLENVVIVETDGTQLVAVKRTDLDLENGDDRARLLAYADNRSGQLDLDFDIEVMAADLEAGLDLSGLWTDLELEELGAEVPDFAPVDESEQPRLDMKKPVMCPECGHEFVPS